MISLQHFVNERNQDIEEKFSTGDPPTVVPTGLVTLWGNFIIYIFAESFDIYKKNYLYHINDAWYTVYKTV